MKRRAVLSLATVGVFGSLAGCTADETATGSDDTADSSDGTADSSEDAAGPSEAGADFSGEVTATLQTSMGDITVDLHADRAPRTVENFVGLATGTQPWVDPETNQTVDGEPFYDDVPFHRVIDSFMIQTGDRTGTGSGGPGYQFDDEFHDELRHDGPGVLSMANSGPNTNGSQFFITLAATPHLDDLHSVFGQVTEGMDIVEAIGSVETDENNRPLEAVALEAVSVEPADAYNNSSNE